MTTSIDDLLNTTNDPSSLIRAIGDIYRREREVTNKTYPELVVQLHNYHNIDILKTSIDAIDAGENPFIICDWLAESISELSIEVSRLVDFTEFIYNQMSRDMLSGRQFHLIQNLIESKPSIARKLVSEYMARNKPFVSSYISNIYQYLAKNSEHSFHPEILALLRHKFVVVRIAALDALSRLNYHPKENKKLLDSTFAVYEDFESNEQIDSEFRILAYAYGNLLQYSDRPKKKLLELSKIYNIEVNAALADILNMNRDKYYKQKWFLDSLFALSLVPPSQNGTLDRISDLVSFLIRGKRNPEFAERFVLNWCLESGYAREKFKAAEVLESVFYELIKAPDLLSAWITRFLNSDDARVHKIVPEIISFCIVRKIAPFPLDKNYLQDLHFEDCVYICRKMFGYIYSCEYLCALCFSILDKSPRNKKIKGLVFNAFDEHIGEDFTVKTIDFLKAKKCETKSSNKIEVAELLIESLEHKMRQRRKLPILKELYQSSRKASMLARVQSKKMSVAMQEAEKNSVFLSVVTKLQLKQGTGSFCFLNEGYTETSKLTQFSESYDLPRSEISHHVYSTMKRFNFRRSKRGDE